MARILIVYHSRLGSVKKMARLIARGVASIDGCEALLRCVDPEEQNADLGVEYADLADCDALILGSPTRFGNMSAEMKGFLDGTSKQWMEGTLVGKPAAVFTSSSSMHGGQESTLLSMMTPLLHHGMLLCGLPFTESALSRTTSGGTPYGASHVAGPSNDRPISDEEKSLCLALGKRVSEITIKLTTHQS
jgi:NAD(P)H dehydrogenase (quinone)